MRRLAHLIALSAFAVAQPLFDLLGRNPEFFSVRGATPGEILVFALGLALVPPAALFAAELLAGLVDARLRAALHLFFVGGLAALVALEALRRLDAPTALPLALAGALGVAAAYAYHRLGALRSTLTLLAAAPLAFLGLFLLQSPASKLVLTAEAHARVASIEARTPVVLVVFDEFPLNSLLDERHLIDAVRYPSFGELARHSTWFRNATAVHEGTTNAVPAILTGLYPKPHQLPRFADHPGNLFTLLGGSYRLDAFERDTRLCPPGLCHEADRVSFGGQLRSLGEDSSIVYAHLLLPEELARGLPTVSESWQDFLERGQDEAGRFDRFLASLRPSPRPTLYFAHVLLPHSPWQYLPSGERYSIRYPTAPWGSDEFWNDDRGLVLQSFQRHLLQVAFVDRLLGRLLARLRATGLYDRSLLVVVADHGISFRAGHKRRPVWPGNLQDIAFVPLFVKLPGQTRGRIVERHVQTIDVLPTIAEVLHARLPWKVDGRSVFSRGGAREVVVLKGSGQRVSAPLPALNARRYAALDRQLALFGSRAPASSLYGIGPFRGLLGRRIGNLPAAVGPVRLDRGRSSLEVSGRVGGAADVAVAASGRVVAVVPVYGSRFWALLPAPPTRLDLLAVSGTPQSPRLQELRGG